MKKKGQWRRALEDYDQALKIKPGSKVYHRDRSVVIAKIEGRACPEERECPACGSAAVARILYGYPRFTDELNQRLAEGTVALGGCCIDKDSPDWHCNHCGYEWGDSRQQLLPEESQKQIAQEKAREEQELAEADQRGVMTITEIHGVVDSQNAPIAAGGSPSTISERGTVSGMERVKPDCACQTATRFRTRPRLPLRNRP